MQRFVTSSIIDSRTGVQEEEESRGVEIQRHDEVVEIHARHGEHVLPPRDIELDESSLANGLLASVVLAQDVWLPQSLYGLVKGAALWAIGLEEHGHPCI